MFMFIPWSRFAQYSLTLGPSSDRSAFLTWLLLTGTAPIAQAKSPITLLFHDFSATKNETLCWHVDMSIIPSTNWFAWLPTKIAGPSMGMFWRPVVSMEEKKMERIEWKKTEVGVVVRGEGGQGLI